MTTLLIIIRTYLLAAAAVRLLRPRALLLLAGEAGHAVSDGLEDVDDVQGTKDGAQTQEASVVATVAERDRRGALLEVVLPGAEDEQEDGGKDDHLKGEDEIGEDDGEVLVRHDGRGLEIIRRHEKAEDGLFHRVRCDVI